MIGPTLAIIHCFSDIFTIILGFIQRRKKHAHYCLYVAIIKYFNCFTINHNIAVVVFHRLSTQLKVSLRLE